MVKIPYAVPFSNSLAACVLIASPSLSLIFTTPKMGLSVNSVPVWVFLKLGEP